MEETGLSVILSSYMEINIWKDETYKNNFGFVPAHSFLLVYKGRSG